MAIEVKIVLDFIYLAIKRIQGIVIVRKMHLGKHWSSKFYQTNRKLKNTQINCQSVPENNVFLNKFTDHCLIFSKQVIKVVGSRVLAADIFI